MHSRPRAAFHTASHLSLWAGLYIAGATLCFAQTTSLQPALEATDTRVLIYAFLASTGVYLLDRVKFRSAWLDPADAHAHPSRYDFLAPRAAAIRSLAFLLIAISAAVGWTISPWLALVSLGACLGIFFYAGRPRRANPRVKDIILVKNSAVAASITGFAFVLTLASTAPHATLSTLWHTATSHPRALLLGGLLLFLRIFADAALCDLDDEHSDRAHGTATLPTSLGRRRAWHIAMSMRLLVGVTLIIFPPGDISYCRVWGVITIAGSFLLRLWSPQKVRDAVDLRMPLEAAAVTLVVHFLT